MLSSAEISIKIHQPKRATCAGTLGVKGDILVSDLATVSGLLYSTSRFMAELYEELLLFTFYRAFVLGYTVMFMNIATCSFGNSLWDALQIFFFHTVLYLVSIASYLLKKYSKKEKYKDHSERILVD